MLLLLLLYIFGENNKIKRKVITTTEPFINRQIVKYNTELAARFHIYTFHNRHKRCADNAFDSCMFLSSHWMVISLMIGNISKSLSSSFNAYERHYNSSRLILKKMRPPIKMRSKHNHNNNNNNINPSSHVKFIDAFGFGSQLSSWYHHHEKLERMPMLCV